jgi:formylmethanofuran dehydrogenase subunit E
MITLTEIGKVESRFREKADPFVMRKETSRIILEKKYTEGLYRLSENTYVQVIFGFHLSEGYTLEGPVYTGEIKGVFASRSPNRPSPLGVTAVRLLDITDNVLTVNGLDAVDGSPVYDIKPFAPVFDEAEAEHDTLQKAGKDREKVQAFAGPRSEMIQLIRSGDSEMCLLKAGTLHGHYCPGLASGVYASVTGMRKLCLQPLKEPGKYNGTDGNTGDRIEESDGMEKILVITETNSCFSDGIQAVTGCTFGNNSLVYHDIGKTAATFVIRGNDQGVRIRIKPGFRDVLDEKYPEFSRLFQKVVRDRAGTEEERMAFKEKGREAAFGLLSIPFDSLFELTEVQVSFPPYAPVVNSVRCSICREEVMESKAVKKSDELFCRQCSGSGFPYLTGEGILC